MQIGPTLPAAVLCLLACGGTGAPAVAAEPPSAAAPEWRLPPRAAVGGSAGAESKPPLPTVPARIPNYVAGAAWGTLGQEITRMQVPLSPAQSQRRMSVPPGFRVELFAAEPDIGPPLAMAWDEKGRLWVIESYDYPNNMQPAGAGHDRIKICADTDGDGRADRFTVFADKLSIPTSLVFAGGGVIVAQAPDMLFLRDTDGDDRADVRRVLFHGWQTADTHSGPNNLRLGLDNWIWGAVGYSGFEGKVGAAKLSFRQGFFRFKPDGSKLEFVCSTSNNTWGLGLSEEGLVFGSTANAEHSVYVPIANRYYEQVRGWHSSGAPGIADHDRIHPLTDKVRQVDWHGGYTAAAGYALYTARSFPPEYWNRVALVAEPTGHLLHQCVLTAEGTDFVSRDGWNLLASDDEWTAPIAADVGPDGAVWWIDWYNFIVQHNPTPHGFEQGKGNAYVTPLRDKSHGRIYRVVYVAAAPKPPLNLAGAEPPALVAALDDDNLFWRMTAQRLLVERGRRDVAAALVERVGHEVAAGTDADYGAVHALWTLEGLGALDGSDQQATEAVVAALGQRSAAVRKAAVEVLPRTRRGAAALLAAGVLADANAKVRLAALLSLAEMPVSAEAGARIHDVLRRRENLADRWIPLAATCAAARHHDGFLQAVLATGTAASDMLPVVRQVAVHSAAGSATAAVVPLVSALDRADPALAQALLDGFLAGWPSGKKLPLAGTEIEQLRGVLGRLPDETGERLLRLAVRWGVADAFAAEIAAVTSAQYERLAAAETSDQQRVAAAQRLAALAAGGRTVQAIVQQLSPRATPELAQQLLAVLAQSRAAEVAGGILSVWDHLTPATRRKAVAVLLGRTAWSRALLEAAQAGRFALRDLSFDQRQQLVNHPDAAVAQLARRLLSAERVLPNPDRQKTIEALLPLAERRGNAARGHEVFKAQCSKCHTRRGEGAQIGPDLTGFAVYPKARILAEVLDPNRSVAGNYRQFSVVTTDGRVLSGLLRAESNTAIELLDSEAKKRVVQRADIEQLVGSARSIMPEGFEKLPPEDLVDLLEFLTESGRFVPLSLAEAATMVSTQGMFYSKDAQQERLVFPDWKPKVFGGIPFQLIDPQGARVANVIVLYSPNGNLPPHLPRSVEIPCGVAAKAIHFLSGVAGWGHPLGTVGSVSMIVRLHYADGQTEDHPLANGRHFADYVRRVDVPQSQLAFLLAGRQVRYLAVHPGRRATIQRLELIKGPDRTAPIVLAVTAERAR